MKRETESLKDFLSREGIAIGRVLFILLIVLGICLINHFYGTESQNCQKEKEQPVQPAQTVQIPGRYIGEFSISHYCSCPICTKSPKGSRTATGHIPREGRTVAVDKKIIPLHSVIYVEGIGTLVAEDVGGAVKGNHLDIYIDDHQRALNLGTLGGERKKVYILE